MDRNEFMKHLSRYRRGLTSRREFLGLTGLGVASAVLAGAMPELVGSRTAQAGTIGDKVSLCTWPSYHDENNFKAFTEATGANVEVSIFGSNEEMMAKLQAGGTGWDVLVPTNYTIEDYVAQDLIEPLDLSLIPNFDVASYEPRFAAASSVNGKLYAIPKDWGTTGYVVNTAKVTHKMTTWREFWDLSMTDYSGRAMVHDYQLTTIGNALKYFGYSFNSIDPKELADAEALLLKVKPHLFGINSDYKPSLVNGDAWLSVAWTGDGLQLKRDMPEIDYILGREGGEIWSDYYAVPKGAPHREAGYALINFLTDPAVNAREVLFHGYPTADSRTNALLPKELLENPIMYPAAELLAPLEFGAAGLITNEARAEIMARFKSA